jgi:ABC-type glycerol-3-phosphate transport system substrate-binding protein
MAKDITELFPRYAPNYYKVLSQAEIRAASVDGRIYAIPKHFPKSQMRCAVVREDLMQKYNIPDIKSFPEIPA